ncbi:MAG: hypothetical protein LBU57_03320 [Dysgonamonadaceae bacterium]|jgi:hypothetical protein|nr:hypothetical protein [Dysgonamonadaceae bacterium]
MRKKLLNLFCFFCFIPVISAQTPQELKSYLPVVPGWTISPDVEVFRPDNLYNRINGAAPLFLENNFREMTSMVYTKGDDYITIQAYRHATPLDAFGMYASERSPDMTFYRIGGEAQGDNIGLYCFAGCIYLKMQASNESDEIGETLRTIAKGLTAKIDPDATYPGLFKYFPVEYKQDRSEAYTTSNYIGHEFLKGVYTCNYKIGDAEGQLFAIDAKSKEEAQSVLRKYFEFAKQPFDVREGISFVIKDKYNGDIPCVWDRQYILGIFHEKGEDSSGYNFGDILEQLIKNIE